MAGRKNKYTVDYFPHYCKGVESKTMFILENKFGLVGYAVWYKTLELLGKSEYHYIDLREETDLLFLISKLGITEDKFGEIYDLLAKLEAIDLELWNNKIVFSDNFVFNVEDAYVRRKGINVLHKLDLCKHLSIKCNQELPKKSKVNNNKEKESIYSENSEEVILIYKAYPTSYINDSGNKSSTGKSSKHKILIAKMINDNNLEFARELFKTIKRYVEECKKSNTYLKNFGTFLNQLPDYSEEENVITLNTDQNKFQTPAVKGLAYQKIN